jgi:hypothetical protein
MTEIIIAILRNSSGSYDQAHQQSKAEKGDHSTSAEEFEESMHGKPRFSALQQGQ